MEAFVATQSLYAAIYDEVSPANVKGFMEREFAACRQQVRARQMDEYHTLFAFNDRIMEYAAQGELLGWTLVFDGVFRAVLELGEPLPRECDPVAPMTNVGLGSFMGDLVCPTGRLIVACMSRVGEPEPLAAIVQPGTYRVQYSLNEDEEFKHALLTERSAYPNGEGPDWRFALRRLQA